jgi:hypothetical membrane protein
MKPDARLLALGGVVGPAAFIGSWLVAGTATEGYSHVDRAISDLAAVGASTRVLMTTGFVVDGLGLIAFGFAWRESMQSRAWIAAVMTGVGTLGVATSPLGGWTGDRAHAAFAGLAYVSIATLPVLGARALARHGRRGWPRASVAVGVASATALAASTLGPAHGLYQRLGLTIGDAWVMAVAVSIATARVATPGAAHRRS